MHRLLLCCPCKTLPYHPSPLLSRHHLSHCAAPLLCWLIVALPPLSLRHHLSCTDCLLNCHLSPRIAASLYHAYHTLHCSLDIVVAAPPSLPQQRDVEGGTRQSRCIRCPRQSARQSHDRISGWYGWVLVAQRRDVKLFFLLSLARAVMTALRTPPRAVPLAPLTQNACCRSLNNIALAAAPFDRKTRCRSVVCAAPRRWISFSLSRDDDKLASAYASESCLQDMT